MVYKLHAELRFATTTARTTAGNTIGTVGRVSLTLGGLPSFVVDRSDPAAAAIQSAYNAIAGLTTPRPLSMVTWHPCYHGEVGPGCTPTATKRW